MNCIQKITISIYYYLNHSLILRFSSVISLWFEFQFCKCSETTKYLPVEHFFVALLSISYWSNTR